MSASLSITQVRWALFLAWSAVLILSADPLGLLQAYGAFSLLGIVGAIFANSTGAGGGVIFVPFFNQLDFTVATTIATSFAIQCCGMTAGALTWWMHYKTEPVQQNPHWSEIHRALLLTVPFSLAGIWLAQLQQQAGNQLDAADFIHLAFGVFSILLSIAIFATLPFVRKAINRHHFSLADTLLLPLIALSGGAITAWLSVGVGEMVAVYLILRRFNVTFSIAVAVILSAFSVWGGVLYHSVIETNVYWPVVMFAGAGAVVGGMLAKHLVLFFSPTHLKMFFAGWIMLLGISALPI